MAEQTETLTNPNLPPAPEPGPSPSASAAAAPELPNRSTVTGKRAREEDSALTDAAETSGGDIPSAKRRTKVAQDVLYRIVVPSRQIGKVIGRNGHRIQKIREDTKATIKVADAVARHEERVIIISSKDNDSQFCDAEHALHQIVTLILKDDDGNAGSQKVGAAHVAANTIRLLIAGSQAGSLIGMSGQNIEQLRNSSGATITVLAQNQVPLCASTYEGDRVVQISGDIPYVLRAVVEIGCQLRDNPPKQVISISPSFNHGYNRLPPQYVDPASAEYVNLVMMIPESLIGGLIGRCGSNISRIRSESGATIKVYGGKGEQNQRQIQLGGNAQQVALAKQRVDEYVYSQLMLQPGSQQPISDISNNLLQGYGQGHELYPNSNLNQNQASMMASQHHIPQHMQQVPQMYSATATDQDPYYGHSYQAPHQSYQAPHQSYQAPHQSYQAPPL